MSLQRNSLNQSSPSRLDKLQLEGKKIIPSSYHSKFDNEFLETDAVLKKPFPARQLPHLPGKGYIKQSLPSVGSNLSFVDNEKEKEDLGTSMIAIQKKVANIIGPNSYADVLTRSTNYSKTQCKYCNRKFAPSAAERHIPICKSLFERHSMNVKFKSKMNESSKERNGLDNSKMFSSGFAERFKLKKLQGRSDYGGNFRRKEAGDVENVQLQNYCPKCSFQFESGHLFCAKCGAKRQNLN